MAFFSQHGPINAHEGDMGMPERKTKVKVEEEPEKEGEEEKEPPRRSSKRSLEEGSSPPSSSNNPYSAKTSLNKPLPRLPPGFFPPKAPLISQGGGKRRAGSLPLDLPEPEDYDLDQRNWQGKSLGDPIMGSKKPASWAANNCCWKVNSSDDDDNDDDDKAETGLRSMDEGVDEEVPLTIFCPAGKGCFKPPSSANCFKETGAIDSPSQGDEDTDEESSQRSPNSLKEGIDRLHYVGKIRVTLEGGGGGG